jgi:ABC-type multidrug transport system fused ATPase/permease subunit
VVSVSLPTAVRRVPAFELRALIQPRWKLLAAGFLLMVINRTAGLVLPASIRFFIDDVLGRHRRDLLLPLVGLVVLATLVQGASSFALVQLLSKAAHRLIASLRRQVQAHVVRLPLAYYDGTSSGRLVSRIMNDVEGLRNLVGTGLVDFAGGLLTAALALLLMLRISAGMTVLTLVSIAVFAVVIFRSLGALRPAFRQRAQVYAEVVGRLTESLGGIRVVKGYRAEAREEAVFSAGVARILDNAMRTLTALSLIGLSSSALLGLITAAAMYLGARAILSGSLTVGGFVSYSVLLGFLAAPLFQVVALGTRLNEALAGLERTREVLAEPLEDQDPRRRLDLGRIEGEVVFDGVAFAYEAPQEVLRGVSFRARPGTVTALVGPSGAGKSTIIALVAGFHSPRQGRVLVDGTDLARVRMGSYRTQLGVVLQEAFLFDGTIRDNVAFSRPQASERDVIAACRLARVDEFAERLERGYDTVVGERGVKLSGGQRQRVSIARALLADPRILILDEATSSLDSESEALVQEGVAHLLHGRTTFVIAHRLSTIRRSHQILFVEGGQIVESGTHDSLLARGGRYADMYRRQHGLEANLLLGRGEGDPVPACGALPIPPGNGGTRSV